jgi:Flp pilus assembly secretin CpaC
MVEASTAAWVWRGDRARLRRCVLAVLAVAATIVSGLGPAIADPLTVILDQAQIVKLPDRISTIVVGNPSIADISVQAGGILVVTGKSYGSTNIVALDRAGRVLLEKAVLVQGPHDNVVVVYRGVDRESYSCTPRCERRLMLGDAQPYFDVNIGQIAGRSILAQTGAPPAKN